MQMCCATRSSKAINIHRVHFRKPTIQLQGVLAEKCKEEKSGAHKILGAPRLEMTDPELTIVRSILASRIDGCGSAELSRVKFLEDLVPAEGVKIISLPTSVVGSSHTCKKIDGES
jgi:hypothetical protein